MVPALVLTGCQSLQKLLPGRDGDRDRSRAEPGSRTVLAGSLVALALEGLLELLDEDEEDVDELEDVVPDASEGATGPSPPSITASSGIEASGPGSKEDEASGAGEGATAPSPPSSAASCSSSGPAFLVASTKPR